MPESRRELLVLGSGGSVPYFTSLPLARNMGVRRAVVVIHGNRRDADRYHARLLAAAALEGGVPHALLLAPHFRTLDDRPERGAHHWSSHGWKIGHRSLDTGRVSSFRVLDELLARVCGAGEASRIFPRLDRVVIAGHSAGGQYVNRYAAGGAGCVDPQIEVQFAVLNPSSYLYVDGRRRSADGGFAPPADGCSGYDEYKYGLRDLNAYMRRVGPRRIRANLFARPVHYLAGERDTRRSGSLDRSCAADLQGAHRLERHRNYRDYARLFASWTGSRFETVPEVGHSGRRMLASEPVRRVLFR